MTPILSDTLAPPSTATKGCSGARRSRDSISTSRASSSPARALAHQRHHAGGGGVRPMRRAEGVVHVDVRQAGELRREGRVVLLLLGMEAEVLEQHHLAAAASPPTSCSVVGADAVGRQRDRPPETATPARRPPAAATARAHACPSGGRGARRATSLRVALEQPAQGRQGGVDARGVRRRRRSSSGTLKSARTKTRLPATSRSRSDRTDRLRELLPIDAGPRPACGSRSPTRCRTTTAPWRSCRRSRW